MHLSRNRLLRLGLNHHLIDVVDASRGFEDLDKELCSSQMWCPSRRPIRLHSLAQHLYHDADDRDGAHEPGPKQDHDSALYDAELGHCGQRHR